MSEPISRGRQYENGPIEPGLRWWKTLPRIDDAWRYLDWGVSAGGYRLVIEHGVMLGLAYDEWPYPWGDSRYLTSHLIADHEIRAAAYWPHHTCSEKCVCPRHSTPMIYWPRGDEHACQDVDCLYGHGIRAAIGAVLPA